MRLYTLILSIIICRAVSGIDGSIFQQRSFSTSSSALKTQNDICTASDSTFTSQGCSSNNIYYQFNCIQDPSFIACFGINGTSSDGIFTFLNLSTNVKNVTYVGRTDYDLSNCSLNQATFMVSCSYFKSEYGAPVNTTNTTV